jgi:2-(1,2-epoxy-1,2-dihydrophenyl)acetyl-CoA isomerase
VLEHPAGFEHLVVTDRGPVRWIRVDRPEKHNAMTRAMAAGLRSILADAAADEACRVVVLTGTGPSFSSGFDTRDLVDGRGPTTGGQSVFPVDELVLFPKPTIAALNGRAVGGGATMAMATDLRVCARSAALTFSLGKLGLAPEWGSSYLLWRQIGWSRALDVLLTARTVEAEEALALGLVTRVVPDGTLEHETQALAETIASLPPGTAEATKEVLRAGLDASYPDARATELRMLGERGRALAAARQQKEQAQQ